MEKLPPAHGAACALPKSEKNKWYFDDYKVIKVFGKNDRVAFQRKGRYARGVTISKDAFRKLTDVSITPNYRLEIEKNTFIYNLGKRIQLIKYCLMKDMQRCEGGFFNFTEKEWQYFWNTLQPKILAHLNT